MYAYIHNTFFLYCKRTFHFTDKLSKATPDGDLVKCKSKKYE